MTPTAVPLAAFPADQVADVVDWAREQGAVAITDLTAALDRYDLPAETIDAVLQPLSAAHRARRGRARQGDRGRLVRPGEAGGRLPGSGRPGRRCGRACRAGS